MSHRFDPVRHGLIACHECDALHRLVSLPDHTTARCARCEAHLYRHYPRGLERSLSLHIAALMLYIMANAFPFLSLKFGNRIETDLFVSGPMALFSFGMGDIGTLVLLTSVVFPLLTIVGSLYLLVPRYFGYTPALMGQVFRLVNYIRPWSLLGVFMLAVLISIVKLLELAEIEVGVSLFAVAAMMPVLVAAQHCFDSRLFWPNGDSDVGDQTLLPTGTARVHGLRHCHCCALLVGGDDHARCPRCGAVLHMRKANSVARCWALLIAAAVLLIPANLLPIMTVTYLGQGDPSTIFGGVVGLIEEGMWTLGLIVLFASIMVPISKLVSLMILLVSVQRGSNWRPEDRTRLYRITEAIGSWSMVDVFILGILASLVSMDALATIVPNSAASYFAVAVVLTMLAAQSFDPRLIWDAAEARKAAPVSGIDAYAKRAITGKQGGSDVG